VKSHSILFAVSVFSVSFFTTTTYATSLSNSHIPAVVRTFADMGVTQNDRSLSVTIALQLNNEAQLDQLLKDQYTVGSGNFHKFLTPAEFRDRFAPTAAQVAKVLKFLRQNNVQVTSVNSTRYFIQATGSVSALSAAFKTEIHDYTDRFGASYFAPATEPQFPADLTIRAVHGLHNVTKFHPNFVKNTLATPTGGYSAADLRSLYQVPNTVDGTGQTMGLFELDGYNQSDVSAYLTKNKLPNILLQNILIDGSDGSAGEGVDEVNLDIELMAAFAPKAKILVYEAPNSLQGVLDLYTKIATDNLATEISSSWGAPEKSNDASFLQSEGTAFKQMAAQGQSIYAASGDSGADGDGSTLSVQDPASQPYVVGVGGTKLNSQGSAYQSESSWNEMTGIDPNDQKGAGGGGISAVWPITSWQTPVLQKGSQSSTTMRNVPDVSLDGDPVTGYAIYSQGSWQQFGGTSCAAPLWAAYTALVNQQRVANGLSVLGFPNPALYKLAENAETYAADFHDIADGSTNTFYTAGVGYDDSTGLGTMVGQNLFNDLTAASLDASLSELR